MSLQCLIDTAWVISYLQAHPTIVARLDELSPQGLALSIISLAELYEGVYDSRDPEVDEQDLNNFLRGVTVLGLDTDIANLILLTNNRSHFERLAGVRIESR